MYDGTSNTAIGHQAALDSRHDVREGGIAADTPRTDKGDKVGQQQWHVLPAGELVSLLGCSL